MSEHRAGAAGAWVRFAAACCACVCAACALAADPAPQIQWLRAVPASTGGATTLHWHVDGADSVSIAPDVGTVPAIGSATITPAGTTTYRLTAQAGSAVATYDRVVVVGAHPSAAGGRYVRMVSPTGGQRFTAPATLRVFAAAYDPTGDGGTMRNAARVDFYVDDQLVAQVPGSQSEYWVFKSAFDGVAAGEHRVWARAVYADPAATLDSEPVWITVDPAPPYARTVTLQADVTLAGAQDFDLIGSEGQRVRLVGNGHRIVSQDGWTGRLRIAHADVFDLGPPDSATPAIDVETTGGVQIEHSTFDTTGTVSIALSGAATASIRGNDFRSNMRMPAAQQPEFEPGASYPAVRLRGRSTAAKRFQGNRIGVGWVDFRNTSNWLIGGDTDADANVAIGPRVGLWVQNSSNAVVRGNVVYHVYYGGWSQGNVMELGGSDDVVVEHNVIGGGSWPIRGFGGTLRYNLVLDAGHEWLWITGDDALVHHNVFAGGDGDVAPIRVIYGPRNVRIHNNTLDGLGAASFRRPVFVENGGDVVLRSNAIVGMPNAPAVQIDGTLDADYNLFSGQQGLPRNYSDGRAPPHDVGGANAQVDPRFARAGEPFRYDWADVWNRRIGVRQILATYRARYTPAAGSPLADAGEPAEARIDRVFRAGFEAGEAMPTGGAGNDIGAVGSGLPADDDLFGKQ